MLKVTGEKDAKIYSGTQIERTYNPEGSLASVAPQAEAEAGEEVAEAAKETGKSLEEQKAHGKQVFMQTCFACHQANGQGYPAHSLLWQNQTSLTGRKQSHRCCETWAQWRGDSEWEYFQ